MKRRGREEGSEKENDPGAYNTFTLFKKNYPSVLNR